MGNEIRVTSKQAEALDKLLKQHSKAKAAVEFMKARILNLTDANTIALLGMKNEDVVDALYKGYNVFDRPEGKVSLSPMKAAVVEMMLDQYTMYITDLTLAENPNSNTTKLHILKPPLTINELVAAIAYGYDVERGDKKRDVTSAIEGTF